MCFVFIHQDPTELYKSAFVSSEFSSLSEELIVPLLTKYFDTYADCFADGCYQSFLCSLRIFCVEIPQCINLVYIEMHVQLVPPLLAERATWAKVTSFALAIEHVSVVSSRCRLRPIALQCPQHLLIREYIVMNIRRVQLVPKGMSFKSW